MVGGTYRQRRLGRGAPVATGSVSASGRHRPVRRAGARPGATSAGSTRRALLIAAHAYRDLDVDAELARLDDHRRRRAPRPPSTGVLAHLFRRPRLHRRQPTTTTTPRNSLLDEVLDRRRGIPITLSVLADRGRPPRRRADLVGVSMPGHFLVRGSVDPEVFVDPFHRGAILDREGCEAAVRHAARDRGALRRPASSNRSAPQAILTRMLINLKVVHHARRPGRRAVGAAPAGARSPARRAGAAAAGRHARRQRSLRRRRRRARGDRAVRRRHPRPPGGPRAAGPLN